MKYQQGSSRGDTLVEVMFATAVAALLILLALTVMNRSLAQIQMAVETTFVRQAIDAEAETLRYIRDQYSARATLDNARNTKIWQDIVRDHLQTSATAFGRCQPSVTGDPLNGGGEGSTKAFYIKGTTSSDPDGDAVGVDNLTLYSVGSLSRSATYAQVGRGIWVEAVKGGGVAGSETKYIDFHVRACWDPPFSSDTKATLGTIVRLQYE